MLPSLTLSRYTCALLLGPLFLCSTVRAYEQGSYLILAVVSADATEPIETSRIQIDRQTFVLSDTSTAKENTSQQVRSEFLSDIAIGSPTLVSFGDVDLNAATAPTGTASFGADDNSLFGTDTTSSFETESTSSFEFDERSKFGE